MGKEGTLNVFFMRHGQTPMTAECKIQSTTDTLASALTSTGYVQARTAAQALAGIDFAAIYASPMLRTLQTADIARGGRSIDIIPLDAIRERTFGSLECTHYAESSADRHSFLVHQTDTHENPHGIETDAELTARFMPVFEQIAIARLGMNILFVTHSSFMRYVLHQLKGYSYEDMKDLDITESAVLHMKAHIRDSDIRYELVGAHGVLQNGHEIATIA